MIKTCDLYLCALRQVYKEVYISCGHSVVNFTNEVKYVLAHKIEEEDYKDVLTKTKYKASSYEPLQSGNWYVRTAEPIITNRKFISEAEATEILTKLNPTFFEVKKKRLRKLSRNN